MKITFREPNFRCRVAAKDRPNQWSARLLYAERIEEVREFMEAKGLIVDPHTIKPYNFAKWKERAEKETKKAKEAIEADRPYTWRQRTWAVLKDHLQDLFHGKCAYCDADFQHVAYGDVEHFRPKGPATTEKGQVVKGHRGYYWLAYEPGNYLPSCQLCNQGSAKKNKFPILGTRAKKPGDSLEAENQLLLNPYDCDFSRHLKFNPSTAPNAGWVSPLDQKGETSMNIYRLNRPGLPRQRRKEQLNARTEYSQAWVVWLSADRKDGLDRVIEQCKSGKREFAAAAMDEINTYAAEKNLPEPFPRKKGTG